MVNDRNYCLWIFWRNKVMKKYIKPGASFMAYAFRVGYTDKEMENDINSTPYYDADLDDIGLGDDVIIGGISTGGVTEEGFD